MWVVEVHGYIGPYRIGTDKRKIDILADVADNVANKCRSMHVAWGAARQLGDQRQASKSVGRKGLWGAD